MKNVLLSSLALAALTAFLPEPSSAHGGSYQGPGDTVPPGGGNGGGGGTAPPSTPSPSGPSTPGGGNGPHTGPRRGPSTPSGGGASGGPPTTPQLPGDEQTLTSWELWWGFNDDAYLQLKAKINRGTFTGGDQPFIGFGSGKEEPRNSLAPSPATVRDKVVPALLETLREADDNDILTGCMIALAKIGDERGDDGRSIIQDTIESFLDNSVQEVRETAAVALGILGDPGSLGILSDLALDTPTGRKACGRQTEVSQRTRAFAAYGLGLIGHRTNDSGVRTRIVSALHDLLESPKMSTRDVKVAALIAMGLVPMDDIDVAVEGRRELDPTLSRRHQLRYLLEFFQDERGQSHLVRAHAPRALARLAQDADPELRAEIAEVLMRCVGRKGASKQKEIRNGATLALGRLGDADGDELDARIRESLQAAAKDPDQQSKRFALIALAQTAGRRGRDEGPFEATPEVRSYLLKKLASGHTQEKPWAALALGVLGHALAEAGQSPLADASRALRSEISPRLAAQNQGAYAIGAGLRRDLEAADAVRELFLSGGDDDARGYCAIGLGLMDDRSSIEAISAVVAKSKYRPELLRHAAIALGLLGDKSTVPQLITMLEEAQSLASQAACASALGFIGDARSVDPLVDMLKDEEQRFTQRARAFAAVALGLVADREPLPWNAEIAEDINYRANTATLTDPSGAGILDIR